jgi:hypothetical protein
MTAVTQEVRKSRFNAGLYLRTKTRTRFWGWGNPPAQTVEQSVNRPWAQLADWLRSVHSLANSGAETQALTSGASVLAGQGTGTASQPAKQRMRFVCTRHFVGLIIR